MKRVRENMNIEMIGACANKTPLIMNVCKTRVALLLHYCCTIAALVGSGPSLRDFYEQVIEMKQIAFRQNGVGPERAACEVSQDW